MGFQPVTDPHLETACQRYPSNTERLVMKEKPLFTDQVAVVTGAGRGIGRSIALALAKQGCHLAICARTQSEIESTQAQVQALGVDCYSQTVDLTNPASVVSFCASTLSQFGRVNYLVNNAGIYLDRGTVEESNPEMWWQTFEVNVRGPYLITKHLLAGMANSASILNITSGKGFAPGANSSSYHMSKGAINLFTGALANELWDRDIVANMLIPGPVATSTFSREDPQNARSAEEILAAASDNLPKGLPKSERLKHPDDVADFVVEIFSRQPNGPSGQIFSLARRPL